MTEGCGATHVRSFAAELVCCWNTGEMQSVVFWLEFRVGEQVLWVIDAGYLVVVMNYSGFVVVLDLIIFFLSYSSFMIQIVGDAGNFFNDFFFSTLFFNIGLIGSWIS